jgi:dinuclear metal center YbgI/SA1388 family protein
MLLKELVKNLNEYLQSSLFQDYCPNGLQVEGSKDVKKLAFGVSASLNVIDQAVEQQADCLIVHHGIFWKGDDFCVVGSKKKKLQKLLENGISLIAYHLPLDAHQDIGNNWYAAKQLGWKNLEPFGDIGVKGELEGVSCKDFKLSLEEYYQHKAHTALGGAPTIHKAALISGGAYKEISLASDLGLDAFITGNFDEPAWHLAHEGDVHFFALGHHATERIGPKALMNYCANNYNLDVSFIDEDNPF